MTSDYSDVIAEFLEVAVHQILYCRNVYPQELFERRQLYQVPVHMSCHPELNSYIVDVISSMKVLLTKKQLDKVVIVISNKDDKPVERFMFSVVLFDGNSVSEDWHLLQVEMALRDFLLKISTCEGTLGAAHKGCTFAVEVHTSESGALALQSTQEDFSWVCNRQQSSNIQPNILPLKSAHTEQFQMQLYVEQCDMQ